MKEKKYTKGAPVETLDEVARAVRLRKYLWWRDRPMHPSFVASMQFRVVTRAVSCRSLCWAAKKEPNESLPCKASEAP